MHSTLKQSDKSSLRQDEQNQLKQQQMQQQLIDKNQKMQIPIIQINSVEHKFSNNTENNKDNKDFLKNRQFSAIQEHREEEEQTQRDQKNSFQQFLHQSITNSVNPLSQRDTLVNDIIDFGEEEQEETITMRFQDNNGNQHQKQQQQLQQQQKQYDKQQQQQQQQQQQSKLLGDLSQKNKYQNISPFPSYNSETNFEDKGDLNDDKETVVDASFISQSSNKQSFGINKVLAIQLAQQNKNTQYKSENQIELLNNTVLSNQQSHQLHQFNQQQQLQNESNTYSSHNNNMIHAMAQSFNNQNTNTTTDKSKSSSQKKDDKLDTTQKNSSTEVYSIPGPKNINSSQYQYVQPTQIEPLNNKIYQSTHPQILINSNYQHLPNTNNAHRELQNIQNQTVDSLISTPTQEQRPYKAHTVQQLKSQKEVIEYQHKKSPSQDRQNSQRTNTQQSEKDIKYPSLDDFLKDNNGRFTPRTFGHMPSVQSFRLQLMKTLLSYDLKETSKSKLLKDSYCIHKTEYYELCMKSHLSKHKQGTSNYISYNLLIKNKTLSDIKDVSISLHQQPKYCEVEFERAQILIKSRGEEHIKLSVNTNSYPILPIECSFLIGNNVPIKHFEIYHSIMKYISNAVNSHEIQRWNPKFKKVILYDFNPNIMIQNNAIHDFYHQKLKDENGQRVGVFQLALPLKSESKINKDANLRFKICMKIDKNFTISVSEFFNDFNSELPSQILKLLQDQIIMTLSFIFGSNKSISDLYLQEKSNLEQSV